MAFVDLKNNQLVLKVVVAGPPAVGKSERLFQIGEVGSRTSFGNTSLGPCRMASLPLTSEVEGREVLLEFYEWHGLEKADVRSKGLFVGLDGFIYIADAREDRLVDSIRQLEHLLTIGGKSRMRRIPSLLLLGQKDEGLLNLAAIEKRLFELSWSMRLELDLEDQESFVSGLYLFGELMMSRIV